MTDKYTLKKAQIILEQRIEECNNKGHIKPVKEKNRCYNCYQRLVYITPNPNELLSSRKLLYYGKPVDEEYLRLLKMNTEHQKSNDYDFGVLEICRDLENKVIVIQADQ